MRLPIFHRDLSVIGISVLILYMVLLQLLADDNTQRCQYPLLRYPIRYLPASFQCYRTNNGIHCLRQDELRT